MDHVYKISYIYNWDGNSGTHNRRSGGAQLRSGPKDCDERQCEQKSDEEEKKFDETEDIGPWES